MAVYELKDSDLGALRGRTILIIGAATGIGHATVLLAHEHGANIAIGDWNEKEGAALAVRLNERVLFRKCDMSVWEDVLDLFQATWEAFGQIDVVLANAGINQEGEWLLDTVDPKGGKLLAPDLKTVRVNLDGMIYVTKCAVHYFSKRPESRSQIVLMGSAASFLETPPLHVYCASKAGVLGLMRSLRTQLPKNHNITINMVAPWHTETAMTTDYIRKIWGNLPTNSAECVGRALLLPAVYPDINGLALFVAGDQIIDLEEGLNSTKPIWMGSALSEAVDEGQRRLIP